MKKRIVSTLLALCMALALLPETAWATEAADVLQEAADAVAGPTDEAAPAEIQFLCWPSAVGPGQPFELTIESVTADGKPLDMTDAQVSNVIVAYIDRSVIGPAAGSEEFTLTIEGEYKADNGTMTLLFTDGIPFTGPRELDVSFTVAAGGNTYHAKGTSVLNVVDLGLLPPANADPNLSAFSFNRIHIGETTGYIDFNLDWQKNRVVFDTTKPLGVPEKGEGYYWKIDFGTTNLEIDRTKGDAFPGFMQHYVNEHKGYTWIDIYLTAKDGGTAQPGTITITIKKEALIGAKMDLVHTVEIIKPCPAPADIAYVTDGSGIPAGVTWTQTLTEGRRPAECFWVDIDSADGSDVYFASMNNEEVPGVLEVEGELTDGAGTLTYTYYFQTEGVETPWNPDSLPLGEYSVVISAGTVVDNMIVWGPSWTKQAAPVQPDIPEFPFYPTNPIPPAEPSRPSKPAEKPVETEKPAEPETPEVPETPVQPQEPVVSAPVYDDVASDAWYSEAAAYVASKGLMMGTSENNFAPDGQMTRAMVWTVLGRMAGADVDGSGGEWYAKARDWAAASGISDGSNPNGGITRQELAVMLWRSAGSPEGTADLGAFSDGGDVAGWASAAMQWAAANGILNGDNGMLKPGAPASRAEVAAMLMRFCEKTGR